MRSAYSGLIGNMVAALIWSVGMAGPSCLVHRLRWWLALMLLASISMAVAVGVPSVAKVATRHGVPRLSILGLALAGGLWGIAPWLHPDAGGDPAFAYGTGAILLGICTASMVASSGSLATTAPLLVPIFVGLTAAAFTLGLIGEAFGLILLALFAGPAHVQAARAIQKLVVLRFEGEWAARVDPLSGLLNRRGIEHVVSERSSTDPAWASIQLIFIDLDRFKVVRDVFALPFALTGTTVTSTSITASVGLSAVGSTSDLYRLLDQAERAMFTAKHEGGDLIRQVSDVPASSREHMRVNPDSLQIDLTSPAIIDISEGATGDVDSVSEQRA